MSRYAAKMADEIDTAGIVLHARVVETLGGRQIPAQVGGLLEYSRFAGRGVDGPFRDSGLLGWGPSRVRFLEIAPFLLVSTPPDKTNDRLRRQDRLV